MTAKDLRVGRPRRGASPESEPEGFGEAVAAGAVTLALMVALAFVGFAWERRREITARAFAADLVERLAIDGSAALMPPWSGLGQGPVAPTAKATFEAVHRLGGFMPSNTGACRLASKFSICTGSRYACRVEGETPAGPIAVSLGLCKGGSGAPWTFDSLDVTMPALNADTGNRADVDPARDGLIRFGSSAPPADPVPTRIRRHTLRGPFTW